MTDFKNKSGEPILQFIDNPLQNFFKVIDMVFDAKYYEVKKSSFLSRGIKIL
jgi:hypothetical protein